MVYSDCDNVHVLPGQQASHRARLRMPTSPRTSRTADTARSETMEVPEL